MGDDQTTVAAVVRGRNAESESSRRRCVRRRGGVVQETARATLLVVTSRPTLSHLIGMPVSGAEADDVEEEGRGCPVAMLRHARC
jgi:hypothetical protein